MVELIDENIGKVIDALKAEGVYDETAIIFTSDHGELLGDFGLWAKGPFFFESHINTPLIACVPNGEWGTDNTSLISSIDIAPTVLDMFGVAPPPYMDGISQLNTFMGEKESERDCCLIEYRNGYGRETDISSKTIVTSDFKYSCYETGDEVLVDLKSALGETVNMIDNLEYIAEKNDIRFKMLMEVIKVKSHKEIQISQA